MDSEWYRMRLPVLYRPRISKAPLAVFMLPLVACAAKTPTIFECSTNPYCVIKNISVSPMRYTFSPATPLGSGLWSCHIEISPPRSANACCEHPTGYDGHRSLTINSGQFFDKYKCTEVPGQY
ncbi:hypothetical protein PGT21_012271 [Puccinia graminis f. sp. tritici]|uniref:Uncharacterized protein n=1 Tax=Puccinia graminis f. sp. tritici TaxID=56615 RepID=A0A5B0LSS8_PUCGR|nr:hypothetical protein PGTUg99_016179 [Puccinia graminis f. sp. tritici]KAA1083946.1 hypothetical protein PGT21_012271 [Puccinia graminis f. sp. tritici]